LPDSSIDLITVAQAIHWFDPETSRNEFLRILKLVLC
jgi:ubiquinone/menaquinone biosynthesis C-methylase UbiE